MGKSDVLKQIPEDWLDRIDRSEYEEEIIEVTKEIITIAAKKLKLEKPGQDAVTIEAAKKWDMTYSRNR